MKVGSASTPASAVPATGRGFPRQANTLREQSARCAICWYIRPAAAHERRARLPARTGDAAKAQAARHDAARPARQRRQPRHSLTRTA